MADGYGSSKERLREEEGYAPSKTVACRYCGKQVAFQGACDCRESDRDYFG